MFAVQRLYFIKDTERIAEATRARYTPEIQAKVQQVIQLLKTGEKICFVY